uniref:Uncharacterized protein n=1 Tax=Arundo donax TaxID=35708 RepID=A0A0A9BVI8_ARUDO
MHTAHSSAAAPFSLAPATERTTKVVVGSEATRLPCSRRWSWILGDEDGVEVEDDAPPPSWSPPPGDAAARLRESSLQK